MRYWKMRFRAGRGGDDYFEACRRMGVAVLGWCDEKGRDLVGDCRRLSLEEYTEIWRRKRPRNSSGRASLRRVAYEMKRGDVIYAMTGPRVVGMGRVTKEGYGFAHPSPVRQLGDQFVRVRWRKDFEPFDCLIRDGQFTVSELTGANLDTIRSADRRANGRDAKWTSGAADPGGRGGAHGARSRQKGGGGGFGDSESNHEVEQAAIDAVMGWFEGEGWEVESVEAERRGYDLECSKGRRKQHVEVKGIAGSNHEFFITANEVHCAERDRHFLLSVVTDALGEPLIEDYTGPEMLECFDLEPTQFRARPK